MKAEEIVDVASEAGVVSSLIYHPEFSFFSENLLPNHFSNESNRIMYLAICNLAKRGVKRIDAYAIIESLKAVDSTAGYAEKLGVDMLNDFIDNADSIARMTVEDYKLCVDNVLEAAFRRDAFRTLRQCESMCFDMSVENISERIYETIDETMMDFTHVEEAPMFRDIVDELWADVEARQDGKSAGIPFKFETLNSFVTLESSELVVLGAPAKGAKSMFMMNQAVDLMRQGKSIVYIDSELSSRLFLIRMVSHLTQIEFVRLKSGRYTQEEREKVARAIEWIKTCNLVHRYTPIFKIPDMTAIIKSAQHRFGKLDCVILDYLKSSSEGNAFDIYNEMGRLTDWLKNECAGVMGVAALAAAQLTATGKLADSAKIARNASTIMLFLNKTPEEMQADGPECGNKKLIVTLNRNGPQHSSDGTEYIDIAFNGNTCTLTEAKQHEIHEPY